MGKLRRKFGGGNVKLFVKLRDIVLSKLIARGDYVSVS